MNKRYKLIGWSNSDVVSFQKEHNLIADGLVGFETMRKLIECGIVNYNSKQYKVWKKYNPTITSSNSSHWEKIRNMFLFGLLK